MVERNLPSERLSERGRTLILAILATRCSDLIGAGHHNSDVEHARQFDDVPWRLFRIASQVVRS
jgi:hypothetical protein